MCHLIVALTSAPHKAHNEHLVNGVKECRRILPWSQKESEATRTRRNPKSSIFSLDRWGNCLRSHKHVVTSQRSNFRIQTLCSTHNQHTHGLQNPAVRFERKSNALSAEKGSGLFDKARITRCRVRLPPPPKIMYIPVLLLGGLPATHLQHAPSNICCLLRRRHLPRVIKTECKTLPPNHTAIRVSYFSGDF